MKRRHVVVATMLGIGVTVWAILASGGIVLAPHPHAGGTTGYATTVTMWFLMMVAMMLPALLPWLSVFGSMATDAYPGRRRLAVVSYFVSGYFAIWLAYSFGAAALQFGLQRLALLTPDLGVGLAVGGILLIFAGFFQLTPLKQACLDHCRSPLGFFLTRWDGGPGGPFKMGARHGVWCVACCWALMALSFVLGVMNLVWMAVLTAMIVAEQQAPRALRLDRAFGFVLGLWGVSLLAASLV